MCCHSKKEVYSHVTLEEQPHIYHDCIWCMIVDELNIFSLSRRYIAINNNSNGNINNNINDINHLALCVCISLSPYIHISQNIYIYQKIQPGLAANACFLEGQQSHGLSFSKKEKKGLCLLPAGEARAPQLKVSSKEAASLHGDSKSHWEIHQEKLLK